VSDDNEFAGPVRFTVDVEKMLRFGVNLGTSLCLPKIRSVATTYFYLDSFVLFVGIFRYST